MRGALVDRCDRCGAVLVKMTPDQHAAVEMVYIELQNQLDWPVGSGRRLTAGQWHQLMVAAYARAQGWGSEVMPSLDGVGFDVVMRTKQSRLTKRQGSELIEFAKSWAIDHGVHLHEPEQAAA